MRLDNARLEQLKSLAVLDTGPEVIFDDLTRAVAEAFGVPVAMVNLLDANRDWFKSSLGHPLKESPAASSFCEVFFNSAASVVVVEDTRMDIRFANHPFVVGEPMLRFYGAARLTVNGYTMGTLCVYDTKPRQVTSEQLQTLKALSRAAMDALARRVK